MSQAGTLGRWGDCGCGCLRVTNPHGPTGSFRLLPPRLTIGLLLVKRLGISLTSHLECGCALLRICSVAAVLPSLLLNLRWRPVLTAVLSLSQISVWRYHNWVTAPSSPPPPRQYL